MKAVICAYGRTPFQFARKGRLAGVRPDQLAAHVAAALVQRLDLGGLAIGHPLGASGARMTGKAAALLQRTGGRYALATQCIAGGQGIATILERA